MVTKNFSTESATKQKTQARGKWELTHFVENHLVVEHHTIVRKISG